MSQTSLRRRPRVHGDFAVLVCRKTHLLPALVCLLFLLSSPCFQSFADERRCLLGGNERQRKQFADQERSHRLGKPEPKRAAPRNNLQILLNSANAQFNVRGLLATKLL